MECTHKILKKEDIAKYLKLGYILQFDFSNTATLKKYTKPTIFVDKQKIPNLFSYTGYQYILQLDGTIYSPAWTQDEIDLEIKKLELKKLLKK